MEFRKRGFSAGGNEILRKDGCDMKMWKEDVVWKEDWMWKEDMVWKV